MIGHKFQFNLDPRWRKWLRLRCNFSKFFIRVFWRCFNSLLWL